MTPAAAIQRVKRKDDAFEGSSLLETRQLCRVCSAS